MGTEDGEIYLWNLGTNAVKKKINGHSSAVSGINYSPDGQKLASCGKDRVFQVVDVNTSLALCSKIMDSPLLSLKWKDVLLLLGSEEGVLYVWNIVEVKLLFEIKAHDGK